MKLDLLYEIDCPYPGLTSRIPTLSGRLSRRRMPRPSSRSSLPTGLVSTPPGLSNTTSGSIAPTVPLLKS